MSRSITKKPVHGLRKIVAAWRDSNRGDRILDVGCGLGPLAVALTGYLDSTARYKRIDVVSSGIACA